MELEQLRGGNVTVCDAKAYEGMEHDEQAY